MTIDTNQFLERYKISRAGLYAKMKQQIIPNSMIIKGNGGSDMNLFNQDACDQLALDGKLGNTARKIIMNLMEKDHTEEHY